jgi:hypothetical protein
VPFDPLLLAAVPVALLLGFGVTLWVVRGRYRRLVRPQARVLEPSELGRAEQAAQRAHADALRGLGFESARLYEIHADAERATRVALHTHPVTSDLAIVELRRRRPARLSFLTIWAVERALLTTTDADEDPFGLVRGHHALRLPDVDPARLHAVHRVRVARAQPEQVEPPRSGPGIERLLAVARRWGEVQVMRRNFRRPESATAEQYALTWRGAFRRLRRALPGAASVRRSRALALGRAEVARFGLDARPASDARSAQPA